MKKLVTATGHVFTLATLGRATQNIISISVALPKVPKVKFSSDCICHCNVLLVAGIIALNFAKLKYGIFPFVSKK